MRCWIESPDVIKRRAWPEQSSGCETRHDGAKEKKNADRSESWRVMPDTMSRTTLTGCLHLLNISDCPSPDRTEILPERHPHAASMLG